MTRAQRPSLFLSTTHHTTPVRLYIPKPVRLCMCSACATRIDRTPRALASPPPKRSPAAQARIPSTAEAGRGRRRVGRGGDAGGGGERPQPRRQARRPGGARLLFVGEAGRPGGSPPRPGGGTATVRPSDAGAACPCACSGAGPGGGSCGAPGASSARLAPSALGSSMLSLRLPVGTRTERPDGVCCCVYLPPHSGAPER